MSAKALVNSCLVTCYYAEKSSSNYIYAPLSTTLGDLRDQIHTKVKSTLEVNWGERDAIHPEPASILISGSTCGSNLFTDNSLTIGDLCTADDHIYAIIPSKQSEEIAPNLAVLFQEYLTEPLLDKVAILDSTIETLEKERNEFATEKSALDKQMSQIMTQVKVMIEEERVKANKRIEEDLAKADEKLAGELAKANKRIDELQSELHSSNDRADEMSFKLQEVDASEVTMVTLEWISLGDTALLDRIKLRNLLNIAQEKLALSCQLTTTPAGASFVWRDRLGYTQDFATRLATAHDFLRQGHVQLDDRTRQFRDSPDGMCLVVENRSDIRERGDRVAHQTPPTRKIYQGALTRCPDAGMRAIADFVCV